MTKRSKDPTERYSVLFIVVMYIISIILHIIPVIQPLILKLTELYLFLITILIFAFGLLNNHRNLITFTFWSLLVFLSIYLIEVITINTGFIFGALSYGETLPTKIANVPLIIPLYWTMTILASYGFFSRIIENRYLRAVISSAIFVLLDIIIEPVAMKLGYWQWDLHKIPFTNYISWYLLSLIFSLFLAIMKIHARSIIFRVYLIIQFAFFILLEIFL